VGAEGDTDLNGGYTMQMPAGDKPRTPPDDEPRKAPPRPEPSHAPDDEQRDRPSMPPEGMPADDRPGHGSGDGRATTAGAAWVARPYSG
jgi:hypothetical protein